MKNFIFYNLLLHGLFVVELISCQLIDIDATLNPEDLNEDQIFASRKERFIKFNHKDNELVVSFSPLSLSLPSLSLSLVKIFFVGIF